MTTGSSITVQTSFFETIKNSEIYDLNYYHDFNS